MQTPLEFALIEQTGGSVERGLVDQVPVTAAQQTSPRTRGEIAVGATGEAQGAVGELALKHADLDLVDLLAGGDSRTRSDCGRARATPV